MQTVNEAHDRVSSSHQGLAVRVKKEHVVVWKPRQPIFLCTPMAKIRSIKTSPLRNLFSAIPSRLIEWRDRWVLSRSGLFDAEWYLATYPDVQNSGMGPLTHFVRYGSRAREARCPSVYFFTPWYLDTNPDVRASGVSPIFHYLKFG